MNCRLAPRWRSAVRVVRAVRTVSVVKAVTSPGGLLALVLAIVVFWPPRTLGAELAAEPDGGLLPALGPAPADSALARELARLPGEWITLAAAQLEARTADTALNIARAELQAARGAERRERGGFQPELFGRFEQMGDRQPSTSYFAGAQVLQTERTLLGAGARVQLPSGTSVALALNTTRLATNSAFASLSPQYDAFGELTLTQPLLKGFGPDAGSELEATEQDRLGAEDSYLAAQLASRAAVELTYWALYAAERDFAVLLLLRDQAASFVAEVRQRVRGGLAGPAEEASALVFRAEREQAVLDGEEYLDQLSDRLAVLLGRRPAGAPRFRPADHPPTAAPAAASAQVVELARRHSPQLAAAERAVAAAAARAAGARWRALPQLDLVGALGGRGLAGTGRDVILDFGGDGPTTIGNDQDTGLGDSVGQVVRREHPTWSLGLVFSLPLGGGRDAGERDRMRAQVIRAEQHREALARELDAEVRSQHRQLERGHRRLGFAADGVAASLEQLRIGGLRFQSGQTTAFELVRLATDLADAQRRYSEALVRTASAAANLRSLTGGAYPASEAALDTLEATAP